jgi:hypothetical protein
MPTPYETVDLFTSGYKVWERVAALNANLTAESDTIDVIDVLPNAGAEKVFSGAPQYTYAPAVPCDPRFRIYWSIYVEYAAGVNPGMEVWADGRILDASTGALTTTTTAVAEIFLPGTPVRFLTVGTVGRYHRGHFTVTTRSFQLFIRNGPVNQSLLRAAFYARPI